MRSRRHSWKVIRSIVFWPEYIASACCLWLPWAAISTTMSNFLIESCTNHKMHQFSMVVKKNFFSPFQIVFLYAQYTCCSVETALSKSDGENTFKYSRTWKATKTQHFCHRKRKRESDTSDKVQNSKLHSTISILTYYIISLFSTM